MVVYAVFKEVTVKDLTSYESFDVNYTL